MISGCTFQNRPPLLSPIPPKAATNTPDPIERLTQVALGFTPTPLPSPTPWEYVTQTAAPPMTNLTMQGINPLTGLMAANPSNLEQRPVMVKLANWPRSLRPAAGLNQADVVFEYYIGHQMNHFLALFHASDSISVAPLAPARLMDARLTEHYQGSLLHDSADKTVGEVFETVLTDRTFARGYVPCPPMCTLTTSTGEDTYVDTANFRKYLAAEGITSSTPQLASFEFQNQLAEWDDLALNLSLLYADFSVMDWRYDSETTQYALWQDFEDNTGKITLSQSVDRNTKEPVRFDNVIILYSYYIEYSSSIYDMDFRETDPNQRALVFRDGKAIYGTWKTDSITSPITLWNADGNPIPLKPGRSWIVFVGLKTATRQISEGVWELNFAIK